MKLENEKKVAFKVMVLMFFGALAALGSLNSFAAGDHGGHEHADHGGMEVPKDRKMLSVTAKEDIKKILEAYEQLHSAFFTYDGKKLEEAVKKLISGMDSQRDLEISKLLAFSKTKLAEISASKSREENNQNFHLVSMALIHIVKNYDVGADYNAYSCSMLKKQWLQNSKKISRVSNPYAPKMPYCGEQETHH